MKINIKKFDELTTKELYEILKVRAEIFVVEQKCIYQDLDDIDYKSTHIFLEEENEIIAYLRYFPKEDEKDTIQIGRVLTKRHKNGHGKKLLELTLKHLKEVNIKKVFIESQVHAIKFYEKFDFKITSDEYLEDGIPHVDMILQIY